MKLKTAFGYTSPVIRTFLGKWFCEKFLIIFSFFVVNFHANNVNVQGDNETKVLEHRYICNKEMINKMSPPSTDKIEIHQLFFF